MELTAAGAGDQPREVRVLVDEPSLKLVTIVLRHGTALPAHRADVPVTIQALEGAGTVVAGGERLAIDRAHASPTIEVAAGGTYDDSEGYFVQPTIITDLPEDHELVKGELFLPILYVKRVANLDEAMKMANDTIYGLTAGFYGKDQAEIDWFLDKIQAGTICFCLLYTSPSPRDRTRSRMPSSA